MRSYSNYSSQTTRKGRQSVILTLWQFCDTHFGCHKIDILSKNIFPYIFVPKKATKWNSKSHSEIKVQSRSKVKSKKFLQRSWKFPQPRGKSRSYLITRKITNLYKSSHQVFYYYYVLEMRTRHTALISD